MATDELHQVFDEAGPDLSVDLHSSPSMDDLDPALIDRLGAESAPKELESPPRSSGPYVRYNRVIV